MTFRHLLKRLLRVSRWYKRYVKTDKEKKYTELLRKIGKFLILHVDSAVQEDISVIRKYTKSNLIYWSEFSAELSALVFQKNICFDPADAEVLSKFSSFLEVYGWMEESEQLNQYLLEKRVDKAAIFAVSLELYKSGHQNDMSHEEIVYMLRKINI